MDLADLTGHVGSVQWGWRARAPAAEPRVAVAWGGDVAARLCAHLARLKPEALALLSVGVGRGVLVVSAANAAPLPWVDGVAYAAPSAQVPALWLPTVCEPDLAIDLVARALQLQFQREPLLLWHEPLVALPLDRLMPASAERVASIAGRWEDR